MAAGRRNLERPSRQKLAANVREIRHVSRSRCAGRGQHGLTRPRIVERAHRIDQRRHRKHGEAADNRRLTGIRRRQQDAREPFAPRRRRDRQDTARGVDRPVQRELAQQHEIGDVAALDDALRGEDAERDRQVERRASFPHIGRRQVDRDPVGGELEPGIPDRALDAVAALADAGVGQADHRERRQTERHVHFDVHRAGVDAKERRGPKAREHHERCARRVAVQDRPVFQAFGAPGPKRSRMLPRAEVQRCAGNAAIRASITYMRSPSTPIG